MAAGSVFVDVKPLVAAATKAPRAVYCLLGESVATGAAAHALIEVLVPAASRDFNLEIYDGRTTPISRALDSLRMRGMFPGRKLVWVRETTIFLSSEKKSDLTAALLEAIDEERRDEAAERLLTLLAIAGWTQELFEARTVSNLSAKEIKESFGTDLDAGEVRDVAAVQAHCRERGLSISAYHDDSALLQQYLEADPSPESTLLLTASAADARKRVFKKLQALDAIVDFRANRERSGALSRDDVVALCRRVAGEFGLRLEPRALELITARAGADAPALATEMEKLCLYVGNAGVITDADVRTAFRDMAESWIFDFTGALAAGDAGRAVPLLRALLAQGDHPLRLMAMIAREVRLLLAARDCLDGPLAGKWKSGVSYATFQSRLQPLLGELGAAAFGAMHPFRVYKYLGDAARLPAARLRRGLIELAELDRRFKSSRGDQAILLETFVRDLCRRPGARPRAAASA